VSDFVAFVITGAVSGSLYAILASGLTLTYSSSGVFNFAYGGIAYAAAVVYYELHTGLHWGIAPSALVAILGLGVGLGWFLDRVMFRRLARSGPIAQIVATVGLSIAIPAACEFTVERLISVGQFNLPTIDNVVTPPGVGPTPAVTFHLFGVAHINTNQIASLCAAVLCAVLLWLVVRKTRLGLYMRATVDRRDLASLRGIDPDRTSSIAWMLSTVLAALTGVLGAPVLNLGSGSFLVLMLVAATAAVFGRLRSIPLAFAAGLGLGVVQALVAGYINPKITLNGLSSSVPFVLTFIGLLVLVVDRRRKAGTAADEAPPRSAIDDKPKLSRGIGWTVAVGVLVVYTLFVANTYWIGVITGGLFLGLVFMSFTVVTGIGGMVSLAQATFVAGAGFVSGLLVAHHAPFLVAALAGTAAAAAAGALVALPALRLGGLALALATLALALIATNLIFQISQVINGQLGWRFNPPALGPIHFDNDKAMFGLALVLGLLCVLLVRNLQRSPSGRAMLAMRSSPVGASATGISPMSSRLALFTFSAALAGLGGVMFTMYEGAITQATFPAAVGLIWLAVAITFGVRRPAFALVAGLAYQMFPPLLAHVTTSTVIPQIMFGLGGIGLSKNPEGLSDTGRAIGKLWTEVLAPRLVRREAGVPVPALAGAGAAVAAANGGVPATGVEVMPGPAVTHEAPAQLRPRGTAPDTGGADPVLELRGIHAGYGDVEVIHGIDLTIPKGKLVGILGANGAGKSTLCGLMAGLLRPWEGEVLRDGERVTNLAPFRRVSGGMLLAPEARGIFADLTVEENLKILLRDKAKRDEAYDRFPVLGQRRRLAAGVLSGGEQQMLTLAPILADPPELLIADEPSLGLAPQIVQQVFGIFTELRSKGTTLVVVEEKVRDVVPVADHLVIVELGRIAWQGHPSEGDDERLATAYLGMTGAAR
jgi:ABC-type branched-subunit amino acid transport system ATPase component/branched-subunit amino acid ABC-type transport system permease component